jgi:hypothetical protein
VNISLKWLQHRRGVATVGIAALLIGGVGIVPAVSSTLAPSSGTPHVFSGCLATYGHRVVFNVVKSPARPRTCPAGSSRVHWNAKGKPGTDGANGERGAVGAAGATGADGAAGPSGADGTNGADGSTGLAGTPGTDGTNGADGPTGAAGADGTNGVEVRPARQVAAA